MAGGGDPFYEFRKETILPEDGDMMSNFITRMVNRNFGLGDVVQPLSTPVFADEKNIMEESPASIAPGKKSSDLTDKSENLPFSGTQEPSVEVGASSIFPQRSKQAEELVSSEKNKNKDIPPHQPEKPEKHTGSTEKSSVEIPGQMKAAEKSVVTEKKRMAGAKPYERKVSGIDSSEPTTLISKLQVADGEDHSLAAKGFIHSERAGNPEQPIPAGTDFVSEQRRTASAIPTIKVTIGRIDVRAVMQKAELTPVRHVVPPKPKLSLDDYLKQRSGGKR